MMDSPHHIATRTVPIRTLGVAALAVLFVVFFNITKHTPALEAVCPFENDPYDAIGSTGIQAAIVFAAIALYRAFRTPVSTTSNAERRLLLLRTELAAVLAVVITLLGDVVAMLRHPTMWMSSGAGYQLAAFVAGQINRLKTIKRQLYGRASLRVLKQHVLLSVASWPVFGKCKRLLFTRKSGEPEDVCALMSCYYPHGRRA